MGWQTANVYVGPCAEWLVPLAETSSAEEEVPILAELGRSLYYVASEGQLPVVSGEGGEAMDGVRGITAAGGLGSFAVGNGMCKAS